MREQGEVAAEGVLHEEAQVRRTTHGQACEVAHTAERLADGLVVGMIDGTGAADVIETGVPWEMKDERRQSWHPVQYLNDLAMIDGGAVHRNLKVERPERCEREGTPWEARPPGQRLELRRGMTHGNRLNLRVITFERRERAGEGEETVQLDSAAEWPLDTESLKEREMIEFKAWKTPRRLDFDGSECRGEGFQDIPGDDFIQDDAAKRGRPLHKL